MRLVCRGRISLLRNAIHDSISNSIDTSVNDFLQELNNLKSAGHLKLWNSTYLEIEPKTVLDVQLISRTSFSSNDYFQDIIDSARTSRNLSFPPFFLAFAAFSFLFGALVVPLLSLPLAAKNILGITSLFGPFLLLSIQSIAPSYFENGMKSYTKLNDRNQQERIVYHEAGHLLLGYICGVAIRNYDITGDLDAGTTIELENNDLDTLKKKTGSFLIVAMAGTLVPQNIITFSYPNNNIPYPKFSFVVLGLVAETLRFGDSKGGAADLVIASEILRKSQIRPSDREGSLRWAVMKALILLRLYRNSLDSLVCAMMEGESIGDCIKVIEEAAVS